MTTLISYTVTMKNSHRSKKVCERGVRPMIREMAKSLGISWIDRRMRICL